MSSIPETLDDGIQCDDECMACSGEICMTHDGPCDCDTADRHMDADGQEYYGSWSGMLRVMEPKNVYP